MILGVNIKNFGLIFWPPIQKRSRAIGRKSRFSVQKSFFRKSVVESFVLGQNCCAPLLNDYNVLRVWCGVES